MPEPKKNPLEGKARTVIIKGRAYGAGDHEEEFEVDEGMSDEEILAEAEEIVTAHYGVESWFEEQEEKGESDDE